MTPRLVWVGAPSGLSQRRETQELLDGASLRRVCARSSRRGQPLLLVIVWTVPAAAAGGCPRPGTCVW